MIPLVLVVDDDSANLAVVEAMLSPAGYDVKLTQNGRMALDLTSVTRPDVILVDIAMPGMSGFELVSALRKKPELSRVPIVMLTARHGVENRIQALKAGADDFLEKPVDMTELLVRVKTLVDLKRWQDDIVLRLCHLDQEVRKKSLDLQDAMIQVRKASLEAIVRLVSAAEYKDEETGAHIRRMGRYCGALARKLGLNQERVALLEFAAQLHDIGKIGVPDQILMKSGALDPEEMRIMKQHTVMGADILGGSNLESIRLAEEVALTHHERWDGSGYPRRLGGADIPHAGRIVAVVDVFDALTSWRRYRPRSYTPDEAFNLMRPERGKHFDPDVLDAFLEILDEILVIRKSYVDVDDARLEAQGVKNSAKPAE